MPEEKNKKSIWMKVALIFAVAVILLISIAISKELKRKKAIEDEISNLRQEAEVIRKDNLNLQDRIAYLESNDFREKEAKDKLNLQKKDEKLVFIKPSPSKEALDITSDDNKTPIKNDPTLMKNFEQANEPMNYQKWWSYFFRY